MLQRAFDESISSLQGNANLCAVLISLSWKCFVVTNLLGLTNFQKLGVSDIPVLFLICVLNWLYR